VDATDARGGWIAAPFYQDLSELLVYSSSAIAKHCVSACGSIVVVAAAVEAATGARVPWAPSWFDRNLAPCSRRCLHVRIRLFHVVGQQQ
jgi:hypothetical protein